MEINEKSDSVIIKIKEDMDSKSGTRIKNEKERP